MERSRFRNALAILRSIDHHELVDVGVIPAGPRGYGLWDSFTRDPIRFYLKLDDEREAKLWALIESRQPTTEVAPKPPALIAQIQRLLHDDDLLLNAMAPDRRRLSVLRAGLLEIVEGEPV